MSLVLFDPNYEDLRKLPIGEWVTAVTSGVAYLNIRGRDCLISLESRPDYCDRGRFVAKLDVLNSQNLHIDWADGWEGGRYYFDKERAKAEVEAWLLCRKQIDFVVQVEGGDRI